MATPTRLRRLVRPGTPARPTAQVRANPRSPDPRSSRARQRKPTVPPMTDRRPKSRSGCREGRRPRRPRSRGARDRHESSAPTHYLDRTSARCFAPASAAAQTITGARRFVPGLSATGSACRPRPMGASLDQGLEATSPMSRQGPGATRTSGSTLSSVAETSRSPRGTGTPTAGSGPQRPTHSGAAMPGSHQREP